MKNIISLLTLCLVTCTLNGQFLERIAIKSYEEIWSDAGTGNPKDLIIWHPTNVPAGYFVFGSIATSGDNPNGKFTTYAYRTSTWHAKMQPSEKNLVRAATGFKKLWDDSGTGADRNVSIWTPTCDEGWVPVGVVANNSYNKPSVSGKNCGCIMNLAIFLVSSDIKKPSDLDYIWISGQGKVTSNIGIKSANLSYKKESVSERRLFALDGSPQYLHTLKWNLAYLDANFDGQVIEVESQGRTYYLDQKNGRVFDVTDRTSWQQVAENVKSLSTKQGRVKLSFKDGTECVDGAEDAPIRTVGHLQYKGCFNTFQ